MCVWHLVGSDSDSYRKGKGSRDRDRDSGKKEAHIHTDTHSVGQTHTHSLLSVEILLSSSLCKGNRKRGDEGKRAGQDGVEAAAASTVSHKVIWLPLLRNVFPLPKLPLPLPLLQLLLLLLPVFRF